MAEDLFAVWNPLTFGRDELPPNLGCYNRNAISLRQKRELKKKVNCTRKDDLEYLSSHPEIRAIIREFLNQITDECPHDIREFGSKFFSQPKATLRELVNKHVEDFEDTRRKKMCARNENSDTSLTTPSSMGYKCASVSMSEVLGLSKIEAFRKKMSSSVSNLSSAKTCPSLEYEFEGMEEQNPDWNCSDCSFIL